MEECEKQGTIKEFFYMQARSDSMTQWSSDVDFMPF